MHDTATIATPRIIMKESLNRSLETGKRHVLHEKQNKNVHESQPPTYVHTSIQPPPYKQSTSANAAYANDSMRLTKLKPCAARTPNNTQAARANANEL